MIDMRRDGTLDGQIYNEQHRHQSVSTPDAMILSFSERTGPALTRLRSSARSRSSCIAQVHELTTIFAGFVCSDRPGGIMQGTRISDDKMEDKHAFSLVQSGQDIFNKVKALLHVSRWMGVSQFRI